jgi:hypothetical protein
MFGRGRSTSADGDPSPTRAHTTALSAALLSGSSSRDARRQSVRPRLGRRKSVQSLGIMHLSRSVHIKSSTALDTTKLSYDPRSWYSTVRNLWALPRGTFFLLPWTLITLLSVAVAVAPHTPLHGMAVRADMVDDLVVPSEVIVVLGSTMSLLLAFRLNISYERWWDGRELWGNVIQGSRSLLTQLIATTNGNLHASGCTTAPKWRHDLHRQVAGWCIAFAISMKHALQRVPMPKIEELDAPLIPEMTPRTAGEPLAEASELCRTTDQDLEGLLQLLSARQLKPLIESPHPPLYAHVARSNSAVSRRCIMPWTAGTGTGASATRSRLTRSRPSGATSRRTR